MAHFGDVWGLPQQSQRVEPPLIDRYGARAPGSLSDPRQLMLELSHELLDADRSGQRLLVLHTGERRLALLIREVEADKTAHNQRTAHQNHERYGVLEKQPT